MADPPAARSPTDVDLDGEETVRVAVYFVSDEERAEATAVLGPSAAEFANVLEGEVDSRGLADLVRKGLIVEQLPAVTAAPAPPVDPALAVAAADLEAQAQQAPPLVDPTAAAATTDAASVGADAYEDEPSAGFASDAAPAGAGAPAAGAAAAEGPGGDFYRVELRGPITREQREQFEALGVDIAAFEPPSYYRTFLTAEQLAEVTAFEHVAAVTAYTVADKLTPELVAMVDREGSDAPSLAGDSSAAGATSVFDCLMHREADVPRLRDIVAAAPGTRVLGTSNLRVRFSAPVDLSLLGALAAMPEVRQLTVFQAPNIDPAAAGGGSGPS